MSEGPKEKKWLAKKWKMWKVEMDGKEIQPKYSHFILTLKKRQTFVITAEYEMTHRGTWSFENNVLTLHDQVTMRNFELEVRDLDQTHLAVEGYEGPQKVTHMTPVTSKDAIHLSHKEHLIAKKWRIYNSTKERNVGSFFEFHEDKTFVYIPEGMTVPMSSGTWDLSKNGKILTIVTLNSGSKMSMDIMKLHRHELTFKNPDTGTINYLHDEFLTKKDMVELEGGNVSTPD